MKKLILSKYLVPISSSPIPKGAILLHDNIVHEIDNSNRLINKYPDAEIIDYKDSIVLPGFINAHCHLELTALANKVPQCHSFSNWIIQLGQRKKDLSQDAIVEGIEKGIKQLWESGTVAVGDISSDYLSFDILKTSPLKGRVFWEFIAVDPNTIDPRFQYLKKSITSSKSNTLQKGISPHSTYTLIPEAFKKINSFIKKEKYPNTIHVGESNEEMEFFKYRIGGLFSFINNFYPIYDDFRNTTPLSYLYERGFLLENSLIVHLNILEEHEIAILQEYHLSVVHCPLSHQFFKHPPFKIKMLSDKQINICLGTDSLASNRVLNLFEEMRQFKKIFPEIASEEIVQMATLNGAKSLQLEDGWGEIKLGTIPRLIALKVDEIEEDIYKQIINYQGKVNHIEPIK